MSADPQATALDSLAALAERVTSLSDGDQPGQPWCCLCGQRHAEDALCNPDRLMDLWQHAARVRRAVER